MAKLFNRFGSDLDTPSWKDSLRGFLYFYSACLKYNLFGDLHKFDVFY